jgi:hypothetical protein
MIDTENIKIGITIALNDIKESMWTNGMKLNILMLINLLKKSNKNYEIHLLNTKEIDLSNPPQHFDGINVSLLKDKYKEMDLIISMGAQADFELIREFKHQKPTNKYIGYKCGNNYVLAIEDMLFKGGSHGMFEDMFDEIWYVPQQDYNNSGYYRTLYRANSISVPFLWDNSFLDSSLKIIASQHEEGRYKKNHLYNPTKEKKVIGIMEPNLNTVKTCVIPILVTEESYRSETGKEKIEKLMITNAKDVLSKNPSFTSMIKSLDIFKDNKISVEHRYQTSFVVSQFIDIVVSHQIMNPLNYLYLDVAYMGYPVLHNAPYCKDVGYYFNESDTRDGAKMLNWILENHDNNLDLYKSRNKQALWRYHVSNPLILSTYEKLIHNLFNGGNSPDLKYNPATNNYFNLI